MAAFIVRLDPSSHRLLFRNGSHNVQNLPDGAAIMTMFVKSWFHHHKSTDSMRRGTKNEVRVFEAIASLGIVEHLSEVGLIQHKVISWAAASPDGIAVISTSTGEVPGVVEIKSAVVDSSVESAVSARNQYGELFFLNVEDDIWWAAVPVEHRAQLLHQVC